MIVRFLQLWTPVAEIVFVTYVLRSFRPSTQRFRCKHQSDLSLFLRITSVKHSEIVHAVTQMKWFI